MTNGTGHTSPTAINPPSIYGHGRLIVEYVASTGPKTDRLENLPAGLHVSAIGTITSIDLIPSEDDPEGEPAGAWVKLTATDGTNCTVSFDARQHARHRRSLLENARVEVYGTTREMSPFFPRLIEARTIRVLSRHADISWGRS